MKRRHLLKSVPAAAGLAVAGCSGLPGTGPSGTVLGRIEVLNSSFVPNRVHLAVERDEEPLFERDLRLAALDADEGRSWAAIGPVWSATRGRYTVRAYHVGDDGDRETSGREYTFTRADYERHHDGDDGGPGCVGAVVTVGSRAETPNGAIGIAPTYMENPCASSGER